MIKFPGTLSNALGKPRKFTYFTTTASALSQAIHASAISIISGGIRL